ncbi:MULTISPECIES: sporulation protein YabP [unclassified Cohnella]|uniref:sporulation protein YabP n=1 Tax=unclassified Cohnella TaxID=2636738 RepID=UPI003611572D
MDQGKSGKVQDVRLQNRKLMDITGVSQVESFDSEEFLLDTSCGPLAVRGHNLHMKNLSLEQGLVTIEGTIDAFVYLDGKAASKSKGLLGKLFR